MNNPFNLVRSAIYRIKHKEKDVFPYYGFQIYFGEFGSGKTLSCVDLIQKISCDYPKCTLITNTAVSGIGIKVITFDTSIELMKILINIDYENNNFGYIVFIDEMHAVLKSLLSSVYSESFITLISQLRKLHVFIIGTSQLYSKNDKAIRDYMRQNGQLIFCHLFLPGLTYQKFVDMSTCKEDSKNQLVYSVFKVNKLYHTPELYQSYDTNKIINEVKLIGQRGLHQYDS